MTFFNRNQAERAALLMVLQGVWEEFPEMSFMQLIAAVVEEEQQALCLDTIDMRVLEDMDIAEAIVAFGNKYLKPKPLKTEINKPLIKQLELLR